MKTLCYYKLLKKLKTENKSVNSYQLSVNNNQLSGLFKITNAAITPGTHPQSVNKNTITKEPHPFPKTDNGGKKMANKTLNKLMVQFSLVYSLDDEF